VARRNAEARRQKEAKQKEAKQKKLLILLIPLFLGLVAWQGPKMYKAFGGQPAAAPPAVTTTAPTDPAAVPVPAAGEGGTATTPAGLPDTDVPPEGGRDRLVSFSRFGSRDPFGQPGGSSGSETSGAPTGGSEQSAGSAVLDVNGSSETVTAGSQFPANDPTFQLVSLTADTAVVGLVSGSFEGGEATVELSVGEQIELVADPDGTRYAVRLVSIG
jgi:hypothetical protein